MLQEAAKAAENQADRSRKEREALQANAHKEIHSLQEALRKQQAQVRHQAQCICHVSSLAASSTMRKPRPVRLTRQCLEGNRAVYKMGTQSRCVAQAQKAAALEEQLAAQQNERVRTAEHAQRQVAEIAHLSGEVAKLRTQLDHTASVSGDSQVHPAHPFLPDTYTYRCALLLEELKTCIYLYETNF